MNRSRARCIPMLALVLLLCDSAMLAAQQIYKSVDADGVVSYSSTPPLDAPPDAVETVKVDPAPSDAGRAAAQQRYSTPRTASGRGASAPDGRPSEQDDTASKKAGKASGSTTSSNAQPQAAPSGSRTSRPVGAAYVPERGRAAAQLPSARTSR